jgi:ABC-type Fe3+/spermidine/putrescine transport system ATPase subunit
VPVTSSEPSQPTAAISLRAVSKSYAGRPALQHVDLDIREGEFFCLLGPSGCGKTTTLNVIGGFVAPSSGSVHIRGVQVDRLPPHRRDANTVFQSYALFPHMTVAQNVGFGLRMAKVPPRDAAARVGEALALVGLEDDGRRLPAELSGGQQQRVAVARALVNRPAVLLLDEPLGALDLKLRKRLQLELAEIHREVGTVFVYVTHDQDEALALADRIAVMRNGAIEQIGSPSEIYLRPRSRFVAEFIGESNFFPDQGGTVLVRPEAISVTAVATSAGLRGEVMQVSFLGNCTRVAVRCEQLDRPVLAEMHGTAATRVLELVTGQAVQLDWPPEAEVPIDDPPYSDAASPAATEEVVGCKSD